MLQNILYASPLNNKDS